MTQADNADYVNGAGCSRCFHCSHAACFVMPSASPMSCQERPSARAAETAQMRSTLASVALAWASAMRSMGVRSSWIGIRQVYLTRQGNLT